MNSPELLGPQLPETDESTESSNVSTTLLHPDLMTNIFQVTGDEHDTDFAKEILGRRILHVSENSNGMVVTLRTAMTRQDFMDTINPNHLFDFGVKADFRSSESKNRGVFLEKEVDEAGQTKESEEGSSL